MVAFVAGSATHIHGGVETKSSLCSLSRSATALLAHSPLSCILPCVLILDVCFVENHDMMLDVVYFLCHALLALRACATAATTRTERDSTKRNLHLHHLRPCRAPSPAAYPKPLMFLWLFTPPFSSFGLACFTYFNFWIVPTRHGQHTIFVIPKIRQNEGYKLLSTGIEWSHFHLSPPLPPYLPPLSIHNGW